MKTLVLRGLVCALLGFAALGCEQHPVPEKDAKEAKEAKQQSLQPEAANPDAPSFFPPKE